MRGVTELTTLYIDIFTVDGKSLKVAHTSCRVGIESENVAHCWMLILRTGETRTYMRAPVHRQADRAKRSGAAKSAYEYERSGKTGSSGYVAPCRAETSRRREQNQEAFVRAALLSAASDHPVQVRPRAGVLHIQESSER